MSIGTTTTQAPGPPTLTGAPGTIVDAQVDPAAAIAWSKLAMPAALVYNGATFEQLAFAATQNPSSNANTVDDYEEGTWTPVIGGSGGQSGQTYQYQLGYYVKVGQLCVVQFYVSFTAKGTITTDVMIKGLPFGANLGALGFATNAILYGNLATNWIDIILLLDPGAAQAYVRGVAAAGTTNNTALATAAIGNTTFFAGSLVYRTAA